MTKNSDNLLNLLQDSQSWPGDYTFKLVVPKNSLTELESRTQSTITLKKTPSRTGKYVSLTLKGRFDTPNCVVSFYESLEGIEGLISL